MYDYDYYYEQEPSEIDLLIEDTVDKIRRTIIEQAKEDVESETQKSKKIQEKYDTDKKHWLDMNSELRSKNNKLQNELEELKTKYEKKRTEIPSLDFEIGETVYYINYDYNRKLVCPTCHGTGYVNFNTDEYGNITTSCPHCHGNSYGDIRKEVEYRRYYPSSTTIRKVCMEFEKDSTEISYWLSGSVGRVDKVFKDRESCQAECDKLNIEALEEAKKHIYQKEN